MTIKHVIVLLLALSCISFAPLDPNPYMARTSCTYNVVGWESPPVEVGRGWVYLYTTNKALVVEGKPSRINHTYYWIANITGKIDLDATYTVQGAVQAGDATIWTEQVQMTCPTIYLPQVVVQGE